MRKILLALVLVFFSLAQGRETLAITAILPMTGDSAFLGEQMQAGMQLRMDEQKSGEGLFDYALKIENDEAKPAKGVLAYKKALMDKADIVLDPCTSDTVAPFAARDKKVFWGMSWDERAAADKLAFIHCTPVGPQATLLLGTLQKLGVSRVAVVNELQQGSMRMEREIKELAPQYGISVEAIRTNPGETDFRTVVLKLKQKHPQAYVSLVLPPAFQNYYTAARQLDPDAIFTAVEGFSYVSDASPYEGCFYVAGNEATPEFAQKFTSATGKPAITFCGNAYDMIDMVINATEHAGAKLGHKPTSAEIAGELYTLRDYPGAVGNLTMGPNRVVQSPAVLKTIKNGKAQLTDFAEIQKSLRR